MPSDIFSRKHLFGSLAPLAERSKIAETRIVENMAKVVRAMQIHYHSLITLHPNAERITEQSGVQWLYPRFQLDCLRKIHVGNRSCYFFLRTRGKGQCG